MQSEPDPPSRWLISILFLLHLLLLFLILTFTTRGLCHILNHLRETRDTFLEFLVVLVSEAKRVPQECAHSTDRRFR